MSKKFSRKLALLVMTTTATTSIMPTYGVNSVIGSEKTISQEIQSIRQTTTGGALTTTGSAIEVVPVEGNLVKNFSFENETAGHPSQWGELKPNGADPLPELGLDTTIKKSGNQSLKFEAIQDNVRGYIEQVIQVEPNTTYSLEAWVKTENINKNPFAIQIHQKPGGSTDANTTSFIQKTGTTDWTYETYEFTTDAKTTSVNMRIALGPGWKANKGSKAWVDDIVLKKVDDIKEVTGIELQDNLTILEREEHKLLPTILPVDATNQLVTWASSDESIATVQADGTVIGIAAGTATITATTNDGGYKAICEVIVERNSDNNLLPNGGFETAAPLDTGDKDYKFWKDGVAPQSWDNVFQPSGKDPVKFSIDTEVFAEGKQSVHMHGESTNARSAFNYTYMIDPTKTYKMSMKVKTDNVQGTGVYLRTQYFSNKNLGTGPGSPKIKGTTDWTTYEMMLTDMPAETQKLVIDIFLENASGDAWIDDVRIEESYRFDINHKEATLYVDEQLQLEGAFTPGDVEDKSITWTSSDETYATVDATGKVTALKPGFVTITAQTKDGHRATCDITIDDPTLKPYYGQLREKWSNRLTLNNFEDKNHPDYRASMTNLDEKIGEIWTTMIKKEGEGPDTRAELWAHHDTSKVSAHISYVFENFRTMATAYASEGSAYYHNEALLKDINEGLDWMYANRYNEHVPKVYDNWFHWNISGPQALSDTLVLLYDEVGEERKEEQLRAINHYNADPYVSIGIYNNVIEMTGANLLDKLVVSAISGMVEESNKNLSIARDGISTVLPYVTKGDGFYEDGSFIQHESIPYAGGYGGVLMTGLSKLLFVTDGSPWEVVDPQIENVYDWIINGFEPLYYKGAIMDMVSGRGISRPGKGDHGRGKGLLTKMLALAETAPADKKLQIQSFIKESVLEDMVCEEDYFVGMNTNDVLAIKALLADDSVPVRGDLELHKVYGSMDRVVHHRPGFSLGISMFSDRISSFEYGNGENKKGWHTADGMTYLYNDDQYQYAEDYWPTVDMMRLPGITTDHSEGTLKDWNKYYSGKSWVGGSSIHDRYGATGMAFKLEPGYSTLEGKKSWFSFDDEVVALGTGIKGEDNRLVETIVENRKIKDSNDNKLIIDGEAILTSNGTEKLENVSWAFLEGNVGTDTIGYYFPEGSGVTAKRESRTGTWDDIKTGAPTDAITKNYVSLAVEHGTNPTNGEYSYVLLPNKSQKEVAAYSEKADITVLANNEDVQAVRENALNMVGINFWNPSTLEYVTAKQPASVMIEEGKGKLTLGISDPTHKSDTVTIVLDQADYEVVSKDASVEVRNVEGKVEITVNTKGTQGRTHHVELVSTKVTDLILDKTNVTLIKGDAQTIKAIGFPENAVMETIQWTIDDESVASIEDKGNGTVVVKGLKEGVTMLTAQTQDGRLTATSQIVVKNNDTGQGGGTNPTEPEKPNKTEPEIKEEKVKEAIQLFNKLEEKEKIAFREEVVENTPYTALKGAGLGIKHESIPEEYLALLNTSPELLKAMGIDVEQLVGQMELEPVETPEFKDVAEKHWANETITKMAERGLVIGYPNGTFKPSENLGTKDAFTFLDRILLINDVNHMNLGRSTVEKYVTDKDNWAFAHVASVGSKLEEETLAEVVALGDKTLSRGLLAQVIFEILNDGKEVEVTNFTDAVGSDYEEALAYCKAKGILNGMGNGEVAPDKAVTRAEMMMILVNVDNVLNQ